jgi:hypothetical protein
MPEKTELSADAKKILDALPGDGSMVGNISLIRDLKIDTVQFFKAKSELYNAGLVINGKGRGGSTSRATQSEEEEKPEGKSSVSDEYDLYDPDLFEDIFPKITQMSLE